MIPAALRAAHQELSAAAARRRLAYAMNDQAGGEGAEVRIARAGATSAAASRRRIHRQRAPDRGYRAQSRWLRQLEGPFGSIWRLSDLMGAATQRAYRKAPPLRGGAGFLARSTHGRYQGKDGRAIGVTARRRVREGDQHHGRRRQSSGRRGSHRTAHRARGKRVNGRW